MSHLLIFYKKLSLLFKDRNLVLILSINHFKKEYLGTFLGSIWTILRPSIFIITIYIIFTYGFKQKDAITNDQLPYISYLLTGYLPWIFFSETVSATSNVLLQNRNFIYRPGFKAIYLPISKTLSALFIHFIFICLMLFILIFNETLSIKYLLQFPLVVFLFYLFVLGISLIVCSIRVFLKDINEVMRLFLQFGFWVTPIFWFDINLPNKYKWLIEINPMYYFIKAYRYIFYNKSWIWDDLTLIFVLVLSFGSFFFGYYIFNNLKTHFADYIR